MGSAKATMAEVAVEINLDEQISHLDTENRILKDRVKTAQAIAERANGADAARVFALEGIILRQREQLRNSSEALWRRKQAIRKLNARYQELVDSVPQAAKFVADRKAANKEKAEWDRAGK